MAREDEKRFYIHVHLWNYPGFCFWYSLADNGTGVLLSQSSIAAAVPECDLKHTRDYIKRQFNAVDDDMINMPCTNDLLTPAMRKLINAE